MTPEEEAQAMIDAGWYQISRRHRLLARLPKGMDGKEALLDGERKSGYPHIELAKWVGAMSEGAAGEHFMRMHSDKYDDCHTTVDTAVFIAFRKLGGDTYESKQYDAHNVSKGQENTGDHQSR